MGQFDCSDEVPMDEDGLFFRSGKLNALDVIAKKKRGIQYCEVATRWGKANGYKEWQYLFIPSKQVVPNSSFMQLAKQFHTL